MSPLTSPLILHIETGTSICSVALSSGGTLLGLKENNNGKAHAQQLSLFIDELITENNLKYNNLNAVVVSKGPGSYTGLRIGVATAKGICFGLNIPLIAIDSLLSLTHVYVQQFGKTHDMLYCPMIDARRMEVYTALFDSDAKRITETEALIVDENSFGDVLDKNKIVFFGDGAEKCQQVIQHPNAIFATNTQASATGMIFEAIKAFENNLFEDTAYFEPLYLKDFVATTPKNKVL